MSIFQLTSSLQQDLLHTLDLNRSRIVLEGNFSPQPASYQTVQLSKDLGQSTILKICAEAEGIFALNVQADEKVSTLLFDREARIIKTFTWTSYNNKASLIALGNDKFAVLSYGALFLCDSQDTKVTKWQSDFLKQTTFSCQTLTPIPGGRIALAGNLEDAGPMQQYWVAIVSHQGKTLSYWISEAPSKASMHQVLGDIMPKVQKR